VSEVSESREAQLLRQVATLACQTEARGFSEALETQGELTGTIRLRIAARLDQLAARGRPSQKQRQMT
jgi:hypothetical protein